VATLITGGTGLIGAVLAERLVRRGERVVLFDVVPAAWRLAHLGGEEAGRIAFVRGDVTSLVDVMDAVKRHDVRAIVHLAYVLGAESNNRPELATRVNIGGTTNVLEAARLGDVPRVLLASSIAVYGPDERYRQDELPLGEDAPTWIAPGLPIYGGGKAYLEQLGSHYAALHGMAVAGLRPSIVYGWGRQTGASVFAGEMMDRAAVGQPVTVGFGDARISMVYVDDVADQFLALLDADAGRFRRRRFFNTGGDTVTVRQLADVVRRVVPDARITVTSAGERDVAGLAASVSDRALTEAVGVRRKFTPIEVGVREHIAAARRRAGAEATA
jgi:nucleoside-diphosphate-sugar epimerase